MKILQTLPELNAGGVERGTLEIARYLIQQGLESVVVSNGGRLVERLENEGSRHLSLPVHRKSLASFLQIGAFRQILISERPDILHIRSRVPGWIAWLAWRGLPRDARPHLVSTVHGFYSINFYSAIMTRGERVIAVSESIREYILRNYPKVPRERIRCIPRGLDPGQYPRGFTPSPEWQQAWRGQFPEVAGRRVLTLPGRITRLKGHEDFLRLLRALLAGGQPIHGVIVGDAHPHKRKYLAEVKSLAARLGIAERVTFTGHRADLREVFAVSDVVCSLSTQPESFGRTTLEALALGRPVVAYAHGGVGEQLRAMFPGGLVPPRNEAALLEVTRGLLSQPPAPAPVPEDYTLEAMCRLTLDTYQDTLRHA